MEKKEKYKTELVPLEVFYKGESYTGFAKPISSSCHDDVCFELDITLNGEQLGTIYCSQNMQWKMKNVSDQGLIDKLGEEIALWYE